jgi:hypothetical protein
MVLFFFLFYFGIQQFSILSLSCAPFLENVPSLFFSFQPASCSEAALSLLTCLENIDCVKKEGRPMLECLKDPVESDDCRAQRSAYSMCKHSQLNMRTRIRGVKNY